MKRLILPFLLLAGTLLSAQNTTTVKSGAKALPYNPMMFGQFMAHLQTSVGGLSEEPA